MYKRQNLYNVLACIGIIYSVGELKNLSRNSFIKFKNPKGRGDISKIYFKNKTPSPGGGSITEIYSEVLAQICLAFAIVKNRPMHWSDVVIGGDDPSLTSRGKVTLKKGWFTPSMQKLVVPPRGKSLNSGNSSFAEDLIDFSLDKCVTGFTWIGAQGRNMFELKKIFKLTKKLLNSNCFCKISRPIWINF